MPLILLVGLVGAGAGGLLGLAFSDGMKRLFNLTVVIIILAVAFKVWQAKR